MFLMKKKHGPRYKTIMKTKGIESMLTEMETMARQLKNNNKNVTETEIKNLKTELETLKVRKLNKTFQYGLSLIINCLFLSIRKLESICVKNVLNIIQQQFNLLHWIPRQRMKAIIIIIIIL